MKNVDDDSGSLILGVNYSSFLQLISMLCGGAVTILSLCVSCEAEHFEQPEKHVTKQVNFTSL